MKCYFSFVRQAFRNASVYKLSFWMEILYCLISMFSVSWLWRALYAQNPGMFELSLGQMQTYGMLAMAMELVFNPARYGPQGYISRQVRSGAIDVELLKPMNFQRLMLYRNSGEILFRFLLLVLPSLVAGALFMGFDLPASPMHAALWCLSIILSYMVMYSLAFLMGLLAMVSFNISHIMMGLAAVMRFFAGQLVPLFMFPTALRVVADVLPFRCIHAIPLEIYVGGQGLSEMLWGIGLQALWALGLYALGALLWRGVHRRLAVQGG